MKRAVVLSAVLVCGALAWWIGKPKTTANYPKPPAAEAPPAEDSGLTLQTNHEAEDVFRRAFWRDPTADDHILHAERREWVAEETGVRRWQWFLAIKPGAVFTDWLRKENPFLTSPIAPTAYHRPPACPDWFPDATTLTDCEIQRHGEHGITLIYDTKANRIFATDSGGGFRHADTVE